jgi:3',5'-cyclic AMP phosphodiesterase CpdA
MKILAHISDLHFGMEDTEVADALTADLLDIRPDLLIVTGDLTQRARRSQFVAAKEYLDRFPIPRVVVPGNHDVPLFNLFGRFACPLARYCENVARDLSPFYADGEIAVFGITTVRSLLWKEGRISVEQMEEIRRRLCSVSPGIFKILATHHPFIPPPDDPGIRRVGRSARALKIIDECGVELLLSGHLHHGYSGDVRPYYPGTRRSIVVVQAGTSISRRTRAGPNAYNVIRISPDMMDLQVRQWSGSHFGRAGGTTYLKHDQEWVPEDQE